VAASAAQSAPTGNKAHDIGSYNDSESQSSAENYGKAGRGSSYNGKERDRPAQSQAQAQQPPTLLEQLPPAHINDLDDYLDMLYQVSGKSEKDREVGLKVQERFA
jgi:hypothetical protein